MDAIVQLIRNALCCVKDLALFRGPLHDPVYTARFYTFPTPFMSKTTPLELLISISQLYAALSCCRTGIWLIFSEGVSKLIRLNRVADVFGQNNQASTKENKPDKKEDKAANDAARKIVAKSLLQEANAALTNTFIGFCVLATGISFFWLVANSLHVTEAGWIGGLPGLIHALTVAEISMLPLLANMIKDASAAIRKSKKIKELKGKYVGVKSKDLMEKDKDSAQWFTYENYTMVVNTSWSPFWTAAARSAIDAMAEEKMLVKEIEALVKDVKEYAKPDSVVLKKDGAAAADMDTMATTCKLEGCREYLYFILNFIAFYGYLLGIIAFYFPEGDAQPNTVRRLKFGYSNDQVDWGGNFAGDLMWTIEPIIIMSSPFIIKSLSNGRVAKKIKSD